MDESIRRKNIEKFRVYTENRFNTLGETNKGMIDRNFDRIMAFYVTQSLAKAPDYQFDGRNEASREAAIQFVGYMTDELLKQVKTDREEFPRASNFCEEFCKEELFRMHRTLQQRYVSYLLWTVKKSHHILCLEMVSRMNLCGYDNWDRLPFI